MKQYPIKKIIKHIIDNDILYDYNDAEAMDVAYDDDVSLLKSFIRRPDLTAFMVNMAIMYVNQGLLYAKSKLSKRNFENYMMWFNVDVDEYMMATHHYYPCLVCFTRRENKLLSYYYKEKPIDVATLNIYPLVSSIIGLSEFYCYEHKCEFDDTIQYTFIPKFFVDRYNAKMNK